MWEQLYSSSAASGRDGGTLYHLRQHFRLVNVPNNVKKNYKSAENLMLSATKAYLCTAFKTWAGLDKLDGVPENLPKLPKTTQNYPSILIALRSRKSSLKNILESLWMNMFLSSLMSRGLGGRA